jgi:NADH:ubiquinone oxidoreductase subunit E
MSKTPPGSEQRVRKICEAHGNRPDELLEILHDVQHAIGFVPKTLSAATAEALNLRAPKSMASSPSIMTIGANSPAGT